MLFLYLLAISVRQTEERTIVPFLFLQPVRHQTGSFERTELWKYVSSIMQETEPEIFHPYLLLLLLSNILPPSATNPNTMEVLTFENPTRKECIICSNARAGGVVKRRLSVVQTSCESWPSPGKCIRCTCLWFGL